MKELTKRIREDEMAMSFEHVGTADNGFGVVDDWKVTIHGFGRELTAEHQGSVNDHERGENPKLEEVFYCIVHNALGVDVARDFLDWISEFTAPDEKISLRDFKKHRSAYEECVKVREDLKVFLGKEKFQKYLYDTDFDV